jgi:hypothetical protein
MKQTSPRMEYLFILDPNNYKGNVLNTMPHVNQEEIASTKVHYSKLSFSQYNEQYGNKLIAIDFDTYYRDFYAPHLASLQGSWSLITEEASYSMLECLPPSKWHNINKRFNVFHISEAITANLYSFCVTDRLANLYWTATRSSNITDEAILDQLKQVYLERNLPYDEGDFLIDKNVL